MISFSTQMTQIKQIFTDFSVYKRKKISVNLFNLCHLCAILFVLFPFALCAQIHVSGFVSDGMTGERLIGANIVEVGAINGTISDNNGFFSLRLRQPAVIAITCIGYNALDIQIERDTILDIRMTAGVELAELVVTAQRWQPPSVVSLSAREMLNIPALGGKPGRRSSDLQNAFSGPGVGTKAGPGPLF